MRHLTARVRSCRSTRAAVAERSRRASLSGALCLAVLFPATAMATQSKDGNTHSISALQSYTKKLLTEEQYHCIKRLWHKESRWNYKAISPTDDYGIPQRHMRKSSKKAIARFLSDPHEQIRWGLAYVDHRYGKGGACKAWAHSQRKGWY